MNHRALHGRENALLLLVVLIHGCPSAFANSKASEFRRDIECEEIVAHSNFEGRAGLPRTLVDNFEERARGFAAILTSRGELATGANLLRYERALKEKPPSPRQGARGL